MYEAIHAQPGAPRRLTRGQADEVASAAARLRELEPEDLVVLIANDPRA
jgi:hypothetical protein